MLRGHLGQTSGLGDYKDFKEKKERITSGQKLKEKTSQALPILCSYKMKSHIEEVIKEGDGAAEYVLGIDDNGQPVGITTECMEASLRTLFCMAKKNDVLLKALSVHKGKNGEVTKSQVCRKAEDFN